MGGLAGVGSRLIKFDEFCCKFGVSSIRIVIVDKVGIKDVV